MNATPASADPFRAYSVQQLQDAMAFLSLQAARQSDLPAYALRALESLVQRVGGGRTAPRVLMERLQRHFRQQPVPPALLELVRPR